MKTALNIILVILVLIIKSDIDNNIANPELNYSNTICALAGILFFGFFRVYADEFLNHISKKS